MIKIILLLLYCVVLISCSRNIRPPEGTVLSLLNADPESWPTACQEYKKELANNDWVYTKLSDRPAIELEHPVWLLNWQNIEIPIPKAIYTKFRVRKENGTIRSFFLWGDEILFFASYSSPEEHMGIYESKSFSRFNKIYFDASTFFEVRRKEFSVTPDDLTCVKEKQFDEAPIAMLLGSKSLISPAGDNKIVYGDMGQYYGWIVRSDFGEGIIGWLSEIVSSRDKEESLTINYRVKLPNEYKDIGLYLGHNVDQVLLTNPAWMDNLNLAITSNDISDWDKFILSAREAGIEERVFTKSELDKGIEELKP